MFGVLKSEDGQLLCLGLLLLGICPFAGTLARTATLFGMALALVIVGGVHLVSPLLSRKEKPD